MGTDKSRLLQAITVKNDIFAVKNIDNGIGRPTAVSDIAI